MKYVVVFELDGGYMDCVAVCDSMTEAYGYAFCALVDGFDSDVYVTLPNNREGDNGIVIELKDKTTDEVLQWVTMLFCNDREVTT